MSTKPTHKTVLATSTLVMGLLSLAYPTCITGILSIPGIICGHLSLHRIRRSPKEYGGYRRALWGLILSYLALTLMVGITGFHVYLQNKIMEIEAKEGKPLSQILDDKLTEIRDIQRMIIDNGLREAIEEREGATLEQITLNRLREIREEIESSQ